jgi:hypothetical protein
LKLTFVLKLWAMHKIKELQTYLSSWRMGIGGVQGINGFAGRRKKTKINLKKHFYTKSWGDILMSFF